MQVTNTFKTYIYNPTAQSTSNKSELTSAVSVAISWLDASQEDSRDEYESRRKVLEASLHCHLTPSSTTIHQLSALGIMSCCPISQALAYHHHLLPLSHTLTQAFLPLVPNPGLIYHCRAHVKFYYTHDRPYIIACSQNVIAH